MKVISNNVMAQAMVGSPVSTGVADPNVGGGWVLLAFSGKLPTSKEGFEATFNTRSVADMYNKAIGIVRNPLTGVEGNTVITLALQSQYIPKGVSYYGTIGSANTPVSQLVPDRIVRSAFTDRNITSVLACGSLPAPADRAVADVDFEFDTPVTIKYLKYASTVSNSYSLVAVTDEGVEQGVGAMTAVSGEANCFSLATPRTSKKFRFKKVGTEAQRAVIFLTDVEQAPSVAATSPTWVALMHCNTLAHGDIDYSDEVMFAAAAVGTQGPFKIVGEVIPNQKTLMFCPKLRFSQRSN